MSDEKAYRPPRKQKKKRARQRANKPKKKRRKLHTHTKEKALDLSCSRAREICLLCFGGLRVTDFAPNFFSDQDRLLFIMKTKMAFRFLASWLMDSHISMALALATSAWEPPASSSFSGSSRHYFVHVCTKILLPLVPNHHSTTQPHIKYSNKLHLHAQATPSATPPPQAPTIIIMSAGDEANKRQKTNGEDYFADIPAKIPFEGPTSKNPLAYKYYDANKVVYGKTMKDWLRFAVCYWHTMRGTGLDPFGGPTISRPWEDGTDSLDNAKRRLRVAFDFMSRLGVEYWTFHDRDIAPEGATLEETNKMLDEVVALAEELQQKTGIKCLWGTQNMFSNKIYMNGAATNPDAHVFAYAAAQTKKVMEITHKLGGENLVFWGGREGYQHLLNTNVKKELDNLAAFFHMVIAYKKKLGATYQILLEPKAAEPRYVE
jgi:hypothetical protein